MEDGETYETHIPEHPGYSKVPPTINNLKNLESLLVIIIIPYILIHFYYFFFLSFK